MRATAKHRNLMMESDLLYDYSEFFSTLIPARSYFIGISEGAFLGKLLVNISVLINEPPTNIMWEYLCFVKDLTFRSGINDKRTLLQSNKGILFNILLSSFGQTNGFQEQFQNWCTAVIWNLVLDPLICQLFCPKSLVIRSTSVT